MTLESQAAPLRFEDDSGAPAMTAFHLWTPPSRQEKKTYGLVWRVVGCCHLSGL
jgi:hypothetical protein